MTTYQQRHEWLSDPHKCDRCGKLVTIKSETKIQSLLMQIVECPDGHSYVRYKLLDVGG